MTMVTAHAGCLFRWAFPTAFVSPLLTPCSSSCFYGNNDVSEKERFSKRAAHHPRKVSDGWCLKHRWHTNEIRRWGDRWCLRRILSSRFRRFGLVLEVDQLAARPAGRCLVGCTFPTLRRWFTVLNCFSSWAIEIDDTSVGCYFQDSLDPSASSTLKVGVVSNPPSPTPNTNRATTLLKGR